ncbi:unnamed protein product [Meganyctiphanes norvegica]|uniref:Uncharacterized protein n=1 Tax=Meganyctiphanes norvegica TaxID=48144 RepID=A0AAV2QYV0_MEGNR
MPNLVQNPSLLSNMSENGTVTKQNKYKHLKIVLNETEVAKLNKYRNTKTAQAVTCFFLFVLQILLSYIGLIYGGLPWAIFALAFHACFILSTIAAIVLPQLW